MKTLSSTGAKVLGTGLIVTLALAILPASPVLADACVSQASGAWNDVETWTGCGGSFPGTGDRVSIVGGHNITVTAHAAALDVSFDTSSPDNSTLAINPGITLDVSQTITIHYTTFSGNTLDVGAGILNAERIDFDGWGKLTISTGTVTVTEDVLVSGYNGAPQIIFTDAGLLRLGGAIWNSSIGNLVSFPGSTVEYNAAHAQVIGDFAYSNLTLSGSGAKTLTGATVNGILSMEGMATTAGTIPTYGINATLQYQGSATQTTGTEFGAIFGGSGGVVVNNPDDLTLGGSKTITNGLTLRSGDLLVGGFNLWLNDSVTCGVGHISATPPSTVYYNELFDGQSVCLGEYYNLTFSNFNKVIASGHGAIRIANTFTPGTAVGHSMAATTMIDFNGTGAQTVPAFNYNHLTISGARSTNSVSLANGGTIGVAGVFTPSATFTSGGYVITNSTVNFNGASGAQTIPGFAFHNLTLGNAGGALLAGNVTVNSTFALGANKLTTAAYSANLGSAGSLTRTSGFVIGNLGKSVAAGASTITFEVGTGTTYAPISVEITGSSGGGSLTGSTTAGAHSQLASSGISSTKYVNRFWSLVPSGFTFTNYNATFTFANPGDLIGSPDTSALIVRKHNAGWMAPVSSSSASTTVTGAGFETFSDYAAGELAGAVPPEVVSITRLDANPTGAASVDFSVLFSESVSGVDTTDFALTITGITGAGVSLVSAGPADTYTVTVDTGSGDGTIRLDLLDDDSILSDVGGIALGGAGTGNGDFTSGELYDMLEVTISGNAGVAGATLTYTGGSTIADGVTGDYSITVRYDWSGTVAPFKMGYSFAPMSRPYASIAADQTAQDYSAVRRTSTDYDRDGKTDPAKFVPATGKVWWLRSSDAGWASADLGTDTTSYVPRSDFDGDGKADPAKFLSSGALYYIESSTGTWGGLYVGADYNTAASGSDFDGDGKTDPAKYLPEGAVWYFKSTTGLWQGEFIGPDAVPYLPASDYDGDGKTDMAKYISIGAIWYLKSSTGTWDGAYIGSDGTPIAGSDFDGDGKTDVAKFLSGSNSLWYQESSTGTWEGVYMGPGAFQYVTASDFDGDGKTDPAKFDAAGKVLWWIESTTGEWDGAWLGAEDYQVVN